MYIRWSAVMSPNKQFHFSLKIQPLQSTFFCNLYFGTLFQVPCTANMLFFNITCMNNELAKYLYTFYYWRMSHSNDTVILCLKQYICKEWSPMRNDGGFHLTRVNQPPSTFTLCISIIISFQIFLKVGHHSQVQSFHVIVSQKNNVTLRQQQTRIAQEYSLSSW